MTTPRLEDIRWAGLPLPPAEEREALGPMLYTAFVEELGVTLTPGQRVVALVAFDGLDPCDLAPEEQHLARSIFGNLDQVSPNARDVLVAVCGGRGGKSYTLVALRMLHLALTVDLSSLAPGQVASGPIVCPDKDLAGEVINYVHGAVDSHPDIAALVVGRSTEHVELRRDDGYHVEIVVRAASARGRTGRGRALFGAALDEAAFFLDADYHVNDEEMFRAVRPRVLPGGQTLVTSTPFAQSGLLYTLFAENHPDPSVAGLSLPPTNAGTALAAHAPTLLLRDVPAIRSVVDAETRRDPDNADREYGARFMAMGASTFFDAAAIDASIDYELELPQKPVPGDHVTCGADWGFRTNSSALAVAHRRGHKVLTGELLEEKPERGKPLKPSRVVRAFARRIAWHGATAVMSDAHYRESILEHLSAPGAADPDVPDDKGEPLPPIGLLDAPTAPADAFIRVRGLMRQGRVVIPNNPRLLRMMRETVSRPAPGGGITVILPKWRTGEHGDLLSAWVLAVYQAWGEVVPPPAPEIGTQEHEQKLREDRWKRRAKDIGDEKAPFWRRHLR